MPNLVKRIAMRPRALAVPDIRHVGNIGRCEHGGG